MTSNSKHIVLSQPMLIGAIMSEIGNQVPGATIDAAQLRVITKAANKIISAFKSVTAEEANHSE